jgi:hypothetical protein
VKKTGLHLKFLLRSLWQRETLFILVIAAVLFAILTVVTSLPPEASVSERLNAVNTQSLDNILENPLNAPYKLASFALTSITPNVRMVRTVSFLFYISTIVAMFYALRHWHTLQTSILTTFVFATNAVVLAISRYATPLIPLMSFYIFASILLWQLHGKSNKVIPFIVFLSLVLLMYVPGALWFIIILAIVYWDRIKPFFKNVKRQAVLIGILFSLIILTPLLRSFILDFSIFREWLLLPTNLDVSTIPRNILRVPSAFIYRMPLESHLNIARLPIFDIASGILFLIGLHAYRHKLRLDRTRVMIGSGLVGCVLGALGSPITAIVFLLPFAFSVIAAGIEFMLDEWSSVFPRNPVAKSFSVILLTTTVLFSSYYQLTRFFVVWPQTPETRAVYSESRILDSRP